MPRIWTDSDRQAAADRARLHRPWAKSTGPRSFAGKNISARNSYKHGRFTYEKQILRWYVRLAALRVKQLNAHFQHYLHKRENELIRKWGLPTPSHPDIKAFYPYFKENPLHSRRNSG